MSEKTSFDLKAFEANAAQKLAKYRIYVSSVIVLGIGTYLLMQINSLTSVEVDVVYKNQKLEELQEVEFDSDAITQLQNLDSSGVDVPSNFSGNRNNPFED